MRLLIHKYKFSLISMGVCLTIATTIGYMNYVVYRNNFSHTALCVLPFLFIAFMEVVYISERVNKNT